MSIEVISYFSGNALLYGDTHASSSAGDHAHCGFDSEAVEVGHFVFSNSLNLLPGDFGNLLTVRPAEPLLTLAASRSWMATGGVLTTKSNDLSV